MDTSHPAYLSVKAFTDAMLLYLREDTPENRAAGLKATETLLSELTILSLTDAQKTSLGLDPCMVALMESVLDSSPEQKAKLAAAEAALLAAVLALP